MKKESPGARLVVHLFPLAPLSIVNRRSNAAGTEDHAPSNTVSCTGRKQLPTLKGSLITVITHGFFSVKMTMLGSKSREVHLKQDTLDSKVGNRLRISGG